VYVELLRSRDFHVKGFRELDTFEQLYDLMVVGSLCRTALLLLPPNLKRDVLIFYCGYRCIQISSTPKFSVLGSFVKFVQSYLSEKKPPSQHCSGYGSGHNILSVCITVTRDSGFPSQVWWYFDKS